MTLPDGWLGASLPEEVWFGPSGSLVQGEGDGHSLAFDFPRLGVAAIDSRWSEQVAMPTVELETGAGMLNVRVRNDTPMTFWSWGAGGPGWATPADGPLEPGEEDVIELAVGDVSGFGGNPLADAVLAVPGPGSELVGQGLSAGIVGDGLRSGGIHRVLPVWVHRGLRPRDAGGRAAHRRRPGLRCFCSRSSSTMPRPPHWERPSQR